MAKAKKSKRVFELARELGVDSKAILSKCQAEGIELNNHMSTVSLGLEMTIREWFSDTEKSETAVETAKKVDLKAVRKAKPRKKIKAKDDSADQDSGGTTTATLTEAPEKPDAEQAAPATPEHTESAEPVEQSAKELAPPVEAAVDPEVEPAAEQSQQLEAKAETSTEQAADQATPKKATKAANAEPQAQEPQPEAPVGPAGPQLAKPKAAELKGPKVIRVEKPDQLRSPRRSSGGGRSGGPPPADRDSSAAEAELLRSRGPVRGRGISGGGSGGSGGEEESSRSPRRKKGGRKGRSAEAEAWGRGVYSEQDLIERQERLSRSGGFFRQRQRDMRKRSEQGGAAQTPAQVGGKVEVAEPLTIKGLSSATGIKAADIIGYLFNKGVMATINNAIDAEIAMEVALEYNIELVVREARTAEQTVEAEFDKRERTDVKRRPPVVTVLGHVDHGKTSLLDRIRKETVASGEHGGITQHIGAYRTSIIGTDGEAKTVVFLDTPGHEAFTGMRARGAQLTDIVVLVVAADDGVMPQTIESINHAKAADVPIVIALNKVDKPEATDNNIQRILGQLAEHELNPVEWGGQTEIMRVSAETGQGITELVEVLDYQAELLETTADYGGSAHGNVIEAELSEGRGAVARLLVREGQLRIGDFIVMGRGFGRVRDMMDDLGRNIEVAGPATPVEISGIDEVPDAGDKFYVTSTLKQAEDIAEQRRELERRKELATKSKVSLDNLFDQMKSGDTLEVRVVVKADVQGSVEVLRKTLEDLSTEQVTVRVLHTAVGGITESDILLAEASDAIVVGFHVIASQRARTEAEHRGVDVRLYRVIYDLIDDVKAAMEGLLAPEKREEVLGHAEVRDVFRVTRVGSIAGCYITDGVVRRNAMIRVTRDGIVIEDDRKLDSLKRFKEDVREVRSGMECGMKIEGYDDIHEGDVLECYVTTEVKAKLG